MEKPLYRIQSYIATDELKIYSHIYKLVKLGDKIPKYIFIGIDDCNGYGTALANYGETSEADAILTTLHVGGYDNTEDEITYINYMSFSEVLDLQKKHINILKERLEKRK